MKYATYWWGIQILAETDGDMELLSELNDRLEPGTPELSYEDGAHELREEFELNNSFDHDFSNDDFKKAKGLFEFNR